jgi:hypothetical protein
MTEKDTLLAVVEIEKRLAHIRDLVSGAETAIVAKSVSFAHQLLNAEEIAKLKDEIEYLTSEAKALMEQHFDFLKPFLKTVTAYLEYYPQHKDVVKPTKAKK